MKMFDAEHPMRVFVSGSSALTELTQEMTNALDDMMAKKGAIPHRRLLWRR